MIETHLVNLTELNRERMVKVLLPKGYEQSTKNYPILYMHDAQNLFRDEDAFFGASWGIEQCLKESELKLIVVGIDCNTVGTKRNDEYGPWISDKHVNKGLSMDTSIDLGGEGKLYIDFIVKELKPFIDSKYRTIQDDTAMAGSSAGGLISTYAMCKYPHIFKKVAALSNAYWFSQNDIEKFAERSDLSAIDRFYFDVGTREETATFGPDEYIHSNVSFEKIIKKKNIEYRFELVEDAVHNEKAWRERFPSILHYLYKN
ncbi:alpha/beta hydrolase [Sutcliffiella rhizosphaerae]|uniref:Alpha/beta hydrolase n=1 Tax=Sutcliffiella rhizosphaerae TaxID=2880967 RepID=A0ABN8ADQ8_9BACI|nr:alpha/beta hydrolase-fold protein [Sutcliffiella rhizosphaerae]CAG9621303.1 putative protein YbbA [Sutcliffiella rhizosphaerae]